MIKTIILEPDPDGKIFSLESQTPEEQDRIFKLAHDNNVFIRDANGELWQVLDLQEMKA